MSSKRKLKALLYITLAGYGSFSAISIYKGDEKFYRNFVMPVVRRLDPEKAHNLAIFVSQYRLLPKSQYKDPDILKVKVFDREFPNPIGIAAGFDKDGKAILGLKDIGFGFVEVGSVTPKPQPGNLQPRVFRLEQDCAIINRYTNSIEVIEGYCYKLAGSYTTMYRRYGFNSEGHTEVLRRLKEVKYGMEKSGIVGINLGRNKRSSDPISDYVQGIKKFGLVADYLVINISSPNTPGLRTMQGKEKLAELLCMLIETRNNLERSTKPPLLLKLAPDLTAEERKDIAEVLKLKECKIDGLIISNTTVERPDSLKTAEVKDETGGLSGAPLKDMSTEMIAEMSVLTGGMPIIGVGGISSGKDAYDKIKAGACLVQIYTVMVYEGPPVVNKIKRELAELLTNDGYNNVCEAVGKGLC